VRTCSVLLLLVSSLSLSTGGQAQLSNPGQMTPSAGLKQHTDELTQQLDVDSAVLSKIPADPLIQRDPLAPILQPVDNLSERLVQSERLKFGATYTFLNQYATVVPDGPRHNQFSGRLDFTGAWSAYDHGSTAGSISLLVRSGTNIGYSQQFNLSDRIGSGLYLNCLQGGGPQEPITLNILYWRQDFLQKKLSFYVGKIHPNEYVTLSMFNNDERTQFLNGANDGNLEVASDGTYAGGAAVEFQATRHLYVHAVAVDTEGAQQRNIETLVDRKYMEGFEVGWSSGSLGEEYRHYRVGMWRDEASAADLDSSMNFPTAGRHLEDSPRALSKGAPSSKSKESVWLGCVHSDAGEICSGWHAITANRAARVSIMKAYVSRSIGFVSLRECGLDQI